MATRHTRRDQRRLGSRRARALIVGLGILGAGAAPFIPNDYDVALRSCPPCLSAVNGYIRADVDSRGLWVEGTTGGDPGTTLDDGKRLLYGYSPGGNSLVGTGYTTVRVRAGGWITDFIPSATTAQWAESAAGVCPPQCVPPCPPECSAVVSAWRVPVGDAMSGAVIVTETLRPAENPFSGREDVMHVQLEAANATDRAVEVGLRTLLDVRVGDNDGAPYMIPGMGALTTERRFTGVGVPAFWLAFESPTYDPSLLRAVGILDWPQLTRPDAFVVAKWGRIEGTRWDYQVDVNEPVTLDSAVALYWDPKPVAAGETLTVRSAYGVAGDRGGGAFVSSPVAAGCEPFDVAFFVTNFELDPLRDGTATIVIPTGVALAAGESASKPLGDLEPGRTASVVWSVRARPGTTGTVRLAAEASFAGGQSFTADAEIDLDCPAPTATPTPQPSATPTTGPSPTTLPSPTTTPPATPEGPPIRLCDFITARVPAAAIAAAVSQPERVHGYLLLCNPNRPQDPFNRPRRALSIRNIGAPYDAVGNPLIFKCSCP